MKETLEKIIELESQDNIAFLSKFPESKPSFLYSKADDTELADFENRFKLKLPQYLIEYFKIFNPIKSNLMFVEILGLPGIIESYDKLSGYAELLDKGFVPIADEDGDLICINSKEESGMLYYHSHEEDNLQKTRETLESYLKNLVKKKEEFNKKNNGH
jgi:hypothetical protein